MKTDFEEVPETSAHGIVCAHESFEAQAEHNPDAIAVTFGRSKLTYRELNERANKLAAYLRVCGLTPGSLCGIAMERSVEIFVGVLGILKTGAAYVPLDPSYPTDRLLFMIDDTRLPLLLSQHGIAEKLANTSTRVVMLEDEQHHVASYPSVNIKVAGYGPAYVMFTSGSTGKPKGLVMGHRALFNLLRWQRETSQLAGNGRKTVQFASLSFDVSFQEMFSTWDVGGTLLLITEECRRDVRTLWQLLVKEQVERLFIPPIVLQHLAVAAEREAVAPTSLREVITAGEQLKITSHIRRMFARLPECTLHNQYGPSESHVVTAHRLAGDPEKWGELPPIGRPISNVEIRILDEHLQPVDTGVAGELYIGGVCLADGYLNRPDLTAEKFITNPFTPVHGKVFSGKTRSDRLYRTGDMARQLPDGNIEFLGRFDHQIKIRGHRIEAGEVEAALLSHHEIREAIVTARQDARSERQLVAYLVAVEPAPVVDELRAFLRKILPEFMIPSTFFYLDALPLTPNGKVNRAALPGLGDERPKLHHVHAVPDNEIETGLVAIWERVLQVTPIGVMDNFFELGGDSLLAVAMLIEINEMFGKNLPASTLIEEGTIKQLAKIIETEHEPESLSLVVIQPLGTRPPLFLLPPIGGEIWGYRSLAPHLGLDQPLYGIRAPGLEGNELPMRDMVEIAAYCLAEVLRIQPHEPFLLGGYSLGGTIAFEMAQQLYARGFRNIKVLIIDEEAPGPRRFNLGGFLSIGANLPKWFVDHLAGSSPGELVERVGGNLQKLVRLVKQSFGVVQEDYQSQLSEFLNTSQLPDTHLKVSAALYEALLNYQPQVYPGRLMLLRTRAQRLFSTYGFDKGWKRFAAQGVEIRIVDGNHKSLGEESHAGTLARGIDFFLQSPHDINK